MAPNARKAPAAKNRATLPSLLTLLVLLAGGVSNHHRLLQGAGAQAEVDSICPDQEKLCLESDVCNKCVLSFEADEPCTETNFELTDTCSLFGTAYCCAAEAAGLEECLNDQTTQEYLECTMEVQGCLVVDMPCFATVDELSAAASPRGASCAVGTVAAAAAAAALAVYSAAV